MTTSNVNTRITGVRATLRIAGLRPLQIWTPDTQTPNFAEECRRQSRLATLADARDEATQRLLDWAAPELEGWKSPCAGS